MIHDGGQIVRAAGSRAPDSRAADSPAAGWPEVGPPSAPRRRAALRGLCAPAVLLAAALALGADWRSPPPGEGPETIPVRRLEGRGYVAVNDLARLLDATKFWRADVRKLVLRAGPHTIVLTADNPFVVVDDATVWLEAPVRSLQGELQVPVEIVEALPREPTVARLSFDPGRERVVLLPPSGEVGSPRVSVQGDLTRLSFPADRPEEAVIVTRSRAHLRLRFGGVFVGGLPDSVPAGSLLRGIRSIAAAGGSAFELTVDPGAVGHRLVQEPGGKRVALELSRLGGPDFEPFALEGPAGERRVGLVVLDPAHGGEDAGVVADKAVEKERALALALLLKTELELRGIRAALTRSDDRDVPAEARAELANRSGADLVIALHFDGFVDPRARGATAYCPPAIYAAPRREGSSAASAAADAGPGPMLLLPWRDVATRHAVQSRALAEAVLSAIELRGQGPTRLRERLASGLLGVNAPGILLECATLTSSADRERVMQEEGLRQLAAAIVDGIEAYRSNR